MPTVWKPPDDLAPDVRWFAIVASADHERPLEVFEAAGWTPAIEVYTERIRSRAHAVPISLRRARSSEVGE